MNSSTINDILNEREVGTILPLLVDIQGTKVPTFFVKDYRNILEYIENTEMVALKNSIIGTEDCLLFLLIFKFDNKFETTYDVWFNYGEVWYQEFLACLKDANRIIIEFRDEKDEHIKSIEMKNTVNEVCAEYIERCNENIIFKGEKINNLIELSVKKKYQTWDIEIANDLLEYMFDLYGSIEELWNDV
ncbi:MAG: hypothetical protein ACRCYE_00145 [Sarcina sp.]